METKVYPTIKNSILLCLLFLGIQLGLGLILGIIQLVFNINEASIISGILTILITLISFGLVLFIGFKKTKRNFNDVFKFNKTSAVSWFATVILMFGFVIISSELDNILNYFLPIPEFFRGIFETMMAGQPLILAVILVAIIPAFAEELFFRGLILDGLNRNYSAAKAIIISSLLFGIIHLNPWQFLSAFIIGIFSAWICINTKSILLSMYIHLFNNLLYTISIRYKNLIPIKGFNSNYATPVEFQPLWFDIIGLVLFIGGVLILHRTFKVNRAKNTA